MAAIVPQPNGALRSSAAPRWVYCAGSFGLEGLYPELDGPEAREGTAAHFYPTEYLKGRAWPEATLAPNGHPIDADMIEHGQLLIGDVQAAWTIFDQSAYLGVEQFVVGHKTIHWRNEGTPDVYLMSRVLRRIILWDYKYGHGYVEAFQNWQCVDYLACIFETHGIPQSEWETWEISVRIVQPRAYHPEGTLRRWDCWGRDLIPLFERLRVSAALAYQTTAPTQTGDHCRDCKGRHACKAFLAVSHSAMDVASDNTPHELPDAAIGVELKRIATAIKRLERRRDALEAQAIAKIRAGVSIPYWKMGFVQSRERWMVPLAEVHTLGDLMGVNLRKDDAVTPGQARKLGIDATVIAAYSIRPSGAAKLEPSDENAAAKAFGKGT